MLGFIGKKSREEYFWIIYFKKKEKNENILIGGRTKWIQWTKMYLLFIHELWEEKNMSELEANQIIA